MWYNLYMFHESFVFTKVKAEHFSILPGKIIGNFNTIFYVWFLCHALWPQHYFLTHYTQVSVNE